MITGKRSSRQHIPSWRKVSNGSPGTRPADFNYFIMKGPQAGLNVFQGWRSSERRVADALIVVAYLTS